jgi:hypothetical protein
VREGRRKTFYGSKGRIFPHLPCNPLILHKSRTNRPNPGLFNGLTANPNKKFSSVSSRPASNGRVSSNTNYIAPFSGFIKQFRSRPAHPVVAVAAADRRRRDRNQTDPRNEEKSDRVGAARSDMSEDPPQESPMKRFLIAALSATAICGSQPRPPPSRRRQSPAPRKAPRPLQSKAMALLRSLSATQRATAGIRWNGMSIHRTRAW